MLTTTALGRTWNFSHAIGRVASVGDGFFGPTAVAIALLAECCGISHYQQQFSRLYHVIQGDTFR